MTTRSGMLRRTSTYAVPTKRRAKRRLTRHSTPMIPTTVLRRMVKMLSHSVTTTAPGKSPKYDEIARRLNSYMLDCAHRQIVIMVMKTDSPRGARRTPGATGGLSAPPGPRDRSKLLLDAREIEAEVLLEQ